MSNMYDILGKLKNVMGLDEKPVETKTETVYESVEARGSITEAVRSLEEKYMGFKKTVAAVKKGGSAEDPEAVAAAIGRKKYGKEKFQKAAAAGKKLGEAAKPDYIDLDKDGDKTEPMKKAAKDAKKAVKEGIDDLTDLDDYQFADPDKDVEVKPTKSKAERAAIRQRIQDLADKKREEEDWYSGSDKESNVRVHRAKYQDEPETDDLEEVAPPGAKAERMVKHIKKGYAKDGKLTKREKGIAYATAWKAHNKGQVEEGVEFGDTIANSKAELKKAKPAKLKESRMIQESDYTYERIGKALAEKNPTLSTASPDFVTAVYNEMVAQGIAPNRARNIIKIDEDFISDVADSYNHYCQEVAECAGPINSFVEESPMAELDEIAALAGLARAAAPAVATAATNKVMDKVLDTNESSEVYDAVNHEEVEDTMDESLSDEAKLERYHELINRGMDPDEAEVMVFNDEDDEEDLDEELASEGNEFSGALAAAKAAGAKEFEVDGKTYTVKEETSVNDIRRLSGLAETEEVVEEDEELAEERDIEYVNTPREKTAPLSAAIPSGTDLHKSKMQDPETANKAANPLTRKAKQVEESLWKSYEDMINDVKAK